MRWHLPPSSTRSRRRARRGTTLIEVLAGLVVLGTLLVSVAIARARFVHQAADAERRLRAAQAADALLSSWFTGPAPAVPASGDGPVEDLPGYTWRTRPIRDADAARLGAMIVRLEVIDTNRSPFLSLDLLV